MNFNKRLKIDTKLFARDVLGFSSLAEGQYLIVKTADAAVTMKNLNSVQNN